MAPHRGSRLRLDLDLGPLLRRHRPTGRRCLLGGSGVARARWPCDTSRVRCGSLVYSVGYRHPAVLAKMITAIDHLSGGRADLGLGAGWAVVEYAAYGIPFPLGEDQARPARGGRSLRARPARATKSRRSPASGSTMNEARNEPRPVQPRLPIWIGGGGEKRTLQDRREVRRRLEHPLHQPRGVRPQARRAARPLRGRSGAIASEIRCAINVGLAWTEESLRRPVRPASPSSCGPACCGGSIEQVLDQIGRYVDAGADQVNIALRAPFDLDALEQFAAALKLG